MGPALLVLLLAAAACALSPDLLSTQWRHDGLGRVCSACISSVDGGVLVWGGGHVASLDSAGRIKWRRSATCPIARAAGSCVTLHVGDDGRVSQSTNGVEDWSIEEVSQVRGAVSAEAGGWVLYSSTEMWSVSSKGDFSLFFVFSLSAHLFFRSCLTHAATGTKIWRTPMHKATRVLQVLSTGSALLLVARQDATLLTGMVRAASVACVCVCDAWCMQVDKSGSVNSLTEHTVGQAAPREAALLGGATLLVLDEAGALYDSPLTRSGPMHVAATAAAPQERLIWSPLWSEAALVGASTVRHVRPAGGGVSVGAPIAGAVAASPDAVLQLEPATNSSLWLHARDAQPVAVAMPSVLAAPSLALLPLRGASGPLVLQQRASMHVDLLAADLSAAAPRFKRSWTVRCMRPSPLPSHVSLAFSCQRDEALSECVDVLFADLAAPPHSHLLDIFGASLGSGQKEVRCFTALCFPLLSLFFFL